MQATSLNLEKTPRHEKSSSIPAMNWRHYVVNELQFDFKIKPSIISPGGKITSWRPNKYPQLPAPDTLKIDYPYIIIDNWLIRFFPLSGVKMAW